MPERSLTAMLKGYEHAIEELREAEHELHDSQERLTRESNGLLHDILVGAVRHKETVVKQRKAALERTQLECEKAGISTERLLAPLRN